LVDSLYTVQADLTAKIIADIGKSPIQAQVVQNWIEKSCPRALTVLNKIQSAETLGNDLASLVVIEQNLRQLL